MNTANQTFRFLGLGRDRRARPEYDPADMGTCFGLDMSLEPTPAALGQAVEAPPSAAWWRRLTPGRHSPG